MRFGGGGNEIDRRDETWGQLERFLASKKLEIGERPVCSRTYREERDVFGTRQKLESEQSKR